MKSEDAKKRIRINKQHWNAIAAKKWAEEANLREEIKQGAPYLDRVEPKMAPYLRDIRGKRIIVLQFGDALVLLACAKKGALVMGVDFSSEQIRLAKKTAKECGVKVKLVRADCQSLPKSVPSSYFDVAVAECGIFNWIESLDAWMKNAFKVLKKGGRLVISDFHPMSICAEEWREGEEVRFVRSYFDQQPQVRREEGLPPSVEFVWKLSDVVNAAIEAGFKVDRLEEYYIQEKVKKGLPLIPTDFLLVATKT